LKFETYCSEKEKRYILSKFDINFCVRHANQISFRNKLTRKMEINNIATQRSHQEDTPLAAWRRHAQSAFVRAAGSVAQKTSPSLQTMVEETGLPNPPCTACLRSWRARESCSAMATAATTARASG
jgi:hypothetical protein